jgi:hypothetical protein
MNIRKMLIWAVIIGLLVFNHKVYDSLGTICTWGTLFILVHQLHQVMDKFKDGGRKDI